MPSNYDQLDYSQEASRCSLLAAAQVALTAFALGSLFRRQKGSIRHELDEMKRILLTALVCAVARSAGARDALEVAMRSVITMTCNSDSRIEVAHWKHVGLKEETVVSFVPSDGSYECSGSLSSESGDCRKGVKIDEHSGRFITIKKPIMSDAGTYICVLTDDSTWSVDVTVVNITSLELLFTSNTTQFKHLGNGDHEVIADSDINLTCNVTFSGARRPYMELRTWNFWRHDHLLSSTESAFHDDHEYDSTFHWNVTETLTGTEKMIVHGNALFPSQNYRLSCYLPNVTDTPYDVWFKVTKPKEQHRHAGGDVTIVIGCISGIIVVSFIALIIVFYIHRRKKEREEQRFATESLYRQDEEATHRDEHGGEASLGLLRVDTRSPTKATPQQTALLS